MERFTIRNNDGLVSVPESKQIAAWQQLAAFEDAYQELTLSHSQTVLQLEELRTAGKTKTARYRELLSLKLLSNNAIQLFERHGLHAE